MEITDELINYLAFEQDISTPSSMLCGVDYMWKFVESIADKLNPNFVGDRVPTNIEWKSIVESTLDFLVHEGIIEITTYIDEEGRDCTSCLIKN